MKKKNIRIELFLIYAVVAQVMVHKERERERKKHEAEAEAENKRRKAHQRGKWTMNGKRDG